MQFLYYADVVGVGAVMPEMLTISVLFVVFDGLSFRIVATAINSCHSRSVFTLTDWQRMGG